MCVFRNKGVGDNCELFVFPFVTDPFLPNANRVEYSQDGIPVSYLYEPNTNRLFQAGNDTVTLDANGNTIQRGTWSYTYNAHNRLTEVRDNGVLVASYVYNLQGQRFSKTANGLTTYYGYDNNGNLKEEFVTSDGQTLVDRIYYFYLNDHPVAMLKGGEFYYIHNDHLGTPRAVTDSASKVVWTWNSDPFGATPAGGSGPGAITFNLRFPGQYYDEETGLHYNHHRYYDPSTGRYLTSDPIGLEGGLNTFGYVGGNPVNYKDIYGLICSGGGPWCGSGWNTKFIPDSFYNKTFDFTQACKNHDICYGTKGKSKYTCDRNFEEDMLKECVKLEKNSFARSSCMNWTWQYYDAVYHFGQDAYDAAQGKAKK